jgi:alkylhydroperoxidase family enzyme
MAELTAVAASATSEPTPRLAPIDTYAGFWLGVLRLAFRWMFGKVMMPLRTLFPRIPGYALPHLVVMAFATRGLSLPRAHQNVLAMRVSRNNACRFCFDIHRAMFMLDKPDPSALDFAVRELDDPALEPALRAVMAYADEVVQQGNVSDATFEQLKAALPERQVAEVVWLAAFTIYLNMLARPLGLKSDGFCAIVQKQQS